MSSTNHKRKYAGTNATIAPSSYPYDLAFHVGDRLTTIAGEGAHDWKAIKRFAQFRSWTKAQHTIAFERAIAIAATLTRAADRIDAIDAPYTKTFSIRTRALAQLRIARLHYLASGRRESTIARAIAGVPLPS